MSLEELFRVSDVVSMHAPLIPETVNLVDGSLLSQMKQDATFINSSRGAIVNEADLCRVMPVPVRLDCDSRCHLARAARGKFPALRPAEHHPHPHIAGSLGGEISRMGDWMVEEMQRYINHVPLLHRIDPQEIELMA